jgi:hypothetical protein
MFNLEERISEWRRRMLAAGINSPAPLEELEAHLRDDVEQQVSSGLCEQTAFETTVREFGRAEILKTEFARARESAFDRLKRLFSIFEEIPNYQPAMNMNNSNQNLEPGWGTYLKTAAFSLPALFVWTGFCVFVMPKLKQVCDASGMAVWKPAILALNLSEFFRSNLLVVLVLAVAGLALLEWRSGRWPRYRSRVFGAMAYALNILALAMITTMAVLAVAAGAHFLPGK